MAITATAILEEGTAANWTGSFTTTATATPTGNREILVFVTYQTFSGSVTSGTLSGQGITWEKVLDAVIGTNRRGVLFRGSAASPSNGALTFTLDTSTTVLRRTIHELELNADASVDAIVQAVADSNDTAATTGGVTLAAFADATNNATMLFGWKENWNEHAMAVDSPLSIVGASVPANTENSRSIVGLYVGEDTTPSFTWDTSSADWLAIGVEVDAATGGGTPATPTPDAIAVAVTLPAATASGAANPAPAAIAAVVTTPAAAARAGATPTPAAIAASTTLPAVSATGAANATPAAISVPVTLPAATVIAAAAATATPAAISVPVTMPAVAARAGAVPTPAAIAAATTLPAATARGDANPAPAVITVPVTLPAASVVSGSPATPTPAAIAAAVTMPAVTVRGDALPTAAAIAVPVTMPAVTVASGTPATATPAAIAASATMPQPAVVIGAVPDPDTISVAITLPAVTVDAFVPVGEILDQGGSAVLVASGEGFTTGPRIGNATLLAQGGTATRLSSDVDAE